MALVASLPLVSQQVLVLVETRGDVTISGAEEGLGLVAPKPLGVITGSLTCLLGTKTGRHDSTQRRIALPCTGLALKSGCVHFDGGPAILCVIDTRKAGQGVFTCGVAQDGRRLYRWNGELFSSVPLA